MIKLPHLASHLLIVTGVVVGLAASAHADVCRNVEFTVQNNKNTKIKATSIEYKFENDNTWRTQGFTDDEVAAFSFEAVAGGEDLTGGEGNRMIALKLHFKAWCGGKWSVPFVSQEDTQFDDTSACQSNSGRSYRIGLPSSDVCD